MGGGSWWINLTLSGIILNCVAVSESVSREDRAPVASRGGLLIIECFIGFPPFSASVPPSHSATWGHLPNKLPAPKSTTQNLLWGNPAESGA